MAGKRRLYVAGLLLTALIVIFGQLIWLPGGIAFGRDRFWIDVLDVLLYALMAPPILWFCAAVRFRPGFRTGGLGPLRLVHAAVQIAILAGSVWLAAEIVPVRRDWIRVAVLFFVLTALVLADLALGDWIEKRRPSGKTLATIALSIGTAALLLAPTPYDVTYPGLAMNMHRYVHAEQGQPQGSIVGLLVFHRPAVPADWLYAAVFPHYEFTLRPPRMPSLSEQLLEAQMMKTDANFAALAVVAERLGYVPDELPKVRYHPYALHEGGPSHGAMLALTMIDQLTPGGVTGGWRVAGTGTIRSDGTIGPIGGIRQKAYTARKAGAEVFFAPASQAQELRGAAGGMEVVPVRSLDEMLLWLKQHEKPADRMERKKD